MDKKTILDHDKNFILQQFNWEDVIVQTDITSYTSTYTLS